MTQQLIDRLKEIVGEEFVKENENMAKHCTFKCGGNAALYVIPGSIDELVDTVKACRAENAPYMVIGNGSNILVRDEGYDGIIIEVNSRINTIDVIGEEIVADAGAKLSAIAMTAAVNDLGGFEFAHGIPGNVGGAVVMNAGAYGGEMKDVIKWVKVLDRDGNVRKLDISELDMGYRTSRIAKEGMIVLQMCIGLFIGTSEEISLIMQMLMQKRKAKQPLEFPSAGSTFKRPEGYFAGKLIEGTPIKEAICSLAYLPPVTQMKEFERIAYIGELNRDEIKSSGYVVDTLEAALWCLWATNTYKDCVLTAVNLGEDTDTVAAVAGGLSGIVYGCGGKNGIPTRWINQIARREWIQMLCDNFESNMRFKLQFKIKSSCSCGKLTYKKPYFMRVFADKSS